MSKLMDYVIVRVELFPSGWQGSLIIAEKYLWENVWWFTFDNNDNLLKLKIYYRRRLDKLHKTSLYPRFTAWTTVCLRKVALKNWQIERKHRPMFQKKIGSSRPDIRPLSTQALILQTENMRTEVA